MSLCTLRNLSNTGRYCKSRNFSNRQTVKHVDSGITSKFLNEFLGYEAYIARNKAMMQPYIGIGCFVDTQKYSNKKSNFQQKSPEKYLLSTNSTLMPKFDSSFYQLPFSFTNETKDSFELRMISHNNFAQLNLKHSVPKMSKDQEIKKSDREAQLDKVFETLSMDLPRVFTRMMDYSVYTPDVEFVNNIKNQTSKGIVPYMRNVMFIRYAGHWKFAYVKFEIIKMTKHPRENTIKVRWRINGIKGYKAFLQFYKFKIWKLSEVVKAQQEVWYDGFSIFYLNDEGKIFRHVADKMMPDDEHVIEEKDKPSLLKPTKFTPSLT